ncbi:MAG: DUF5305 family protein [Peptococcia bacterium]|jgi:hypothetical protein
MLKRISACLKMFIFDLEVMILDLKELITKRKITISAKIRTILIIGVSLCLVTMLIFLGGTLKGAEPVENKIAKYQYSQKANLDYQVFLKPNLLYEENVLEMGRIYPTNFVDQLQTTMAYEFSGDKKAEIRGNYFVMAKVQGTQKEENKEKTLWSKEFLLVPQKHFHSSEGKVKFKEEVPLTFWAFNQFGEEVQKATGIVSNVNLVVDWQIQVEAKSEEGLIKEEFTPQLVIPLCKKHFEVGGDLAPEKAGAIEEIVETKVPLNRKRVVFLSLGMMLCLLILLYLLRFVQAVSPSLWEKQVQQIFKKYGERLVALEKEIPVIRETIIKIKSLDGLVLLADELCKPIYYYRRIIDGKESISFYVFSENKVFIYDLKFREVEATLERDVAFSYSS